MKLHMCNYHVLSTREKHLVGLLRKLHELFRWERWLFENCCLANSLRDSGMFFGFLEVFRLKN